MAPNVYAPIFPLLGRSVSISTQKGVSKGDGVHKKIPRALFTKKAKNPSKKFCSLGTPQEIFGRKFPQYCGPLFHEKKPPQRSWEYNAPWGPQHKTPGVFRGNHHCPPLIREGNLPPFFKGNTSLGKHPKLGRGNILIRKEPRKGKPSNPGKTKA